MQTVIETPTFTRQADKIFSEDERRELIDLLAENPLAGDEIPGTDGVRKLRFAASGRGKRGGACVIYYYLDRAMPIYALLACTKAAKIDMTPEEKRTIGLTPFSWTVDGCRGHGQYLGSRSLAKLKARFADLREGGCVNLKVKDAWRLIFILPGVADFVIRRWPLVSPISAGMADSARYCYAVWLTHLIHAYESAPPPPQVVVEIGPGSSLGVGLAALLSGASKYYGLDVIKHATTENNLHVFDELTELFKWRARIPDGDEFGRLKGYLQTHDFPDGVLDSERLRDAIRPERIERIRQTVTCGGTEISYIVPWWDADIEESSVDFVFSQDTMEHVEDLPAAYKAMRRFLKTGGIVSHAISFGSHGITTKWNGHWTFSDFRWKRYLGRRLYLLNREPLSSHIALLRENGFDILRQIKFKARGRQSVPRNALSRRFRDMSQDDFTCHKAFIQAVKIR